MTQWGRAPGAGRWMPGGAPATLLAFLVAIMAFGYLAKYQYEQLSPTQRQWFKPFVKSTAAAAVDLGPLEYTLQGQTGKRDNAATRDYLANAVYDGAQLWQVFLYSLAAGGALLLLVIPAIRVDVTRSAARRLGRYIKGARRLEAKPFNRAVRPREWRRWGRREEAGLVIRQDRAPAIILPKRIDNSHAQIVGTTGGGKTTLINAHVEQSEQRGDAVVFYDPEGTFLKTWYRPERGDVILNPGDQRTWAWDSADEVRDPLEAMTLATSLVPRDPRETNKFFTSSARTIAAYLLSLKLSPQQMVEYLTDERKLARLLHGTHIQDVLPMDSPGQRAGVKSPLNMLAVTLALCPTPRACGGRVWSAATWAETRKGWVFITGTPTTEEQLRPLQTLWFDALILRMMTRPGPPTKLVFDELASLHKLSQLHTALERGRKHNISVILGFQGYSQVDELYDRQADTMLAQAASTYILRVPDPRSAERAAKTIGSHEIERVEESRQHGWNRGGRSENLRRSIEPLFMDSQIQGLEDLRGILKVRNYVTTLQIPIVNRPARAAAFVPRLPRPLPKLPTSLPPAEAITFDPPLPDAAQSVSLPLE
jgi:hypothetical protein